MKLNGFDRLVGGKCIVTDRGDNVPLQGDRDRYLRIVTRIGQDLDRIVIENGVFISVVNLYTADGLGRRGAQGDIKRPCNGCQQEDGRK